MALPRAYWKGYLKLSLVTCQVALYPASSKSQKTRFHQINRKTGNRLRQQMVDEETGRAVDKRSSQRSPDGGRLSSRNWVRRVKGCARTACRRHEYAYWRRSNWRERS